MNDQIDEQELQRLLDGALTLDERAMLIQYADDHPENWKRIALAYVEEQVLRDELGAIAKLSNPTASLADGTDRERTPTKRFGMSILSQAVALCLIVTAAALLGRASVDQDDFPQASVDSPGDYTILVTPDSQLAPASSKPSDSMRLTNVGPIDPVEKMLTPLFDQDSQGAFRELGYTVQEEPVIFVFEGPKGEQYVVPRRNVSFVAHRE